MDTIFDFIEPLEKILIILNLNRVSPKDAMYIPIYAEYLLMCEDRKSTYHGRIKTLSEKYGIPKGTLRRKIDLFSKRLKK